MSLRRASPGQHKRGPSEAGSDGRKSAHVEGPVKPLEMMTALSRMPGCSMSPLAQNRSRPVLPSRAACHGSASTFESHHAAAFLIISHRSTPCISRRLAVVRAPGGHSRHARNRKRQFYAPSKGAEDGGRPGQEGRTQCPGLHWPSVTDAMWQACDQPNSDHTAQAFGSICMSCRIS